MRSILTVLVRHHNPANLTPALWERKQSDEQRVLLTLRSNLAVCSLSIRQLNALRGATQRRIFRTRKGQEKTTLSIEVHKRSEQLDWELLRKLQVRNQAYKILNFFQICRLSFE